MKNIKEIMRCLGVKFNKLIYNITSFLKRNINRLTLSKVLVIFVVGLVSRVLVNNFWDVNVFVDYLNTISLTYYGFMSIFVVLVNELYSYIDIKIIPKISKDVFNITSIRRAFVSLLSLRERNKVSLISGETSVKGFIGSKESNSSNVLFAGNSSDNNVNRGRGNGEGIRSKGVSGSSKGVSGSGNSKGVSGSLKGVSGSLKGVGGDYIDRDYVDKGLRSKKGVSNMRSYYDNTTKSTTPKSNTPIVHNSVRSQNVRSGNSGSYVDSVSVVSDTSRYLYIGYQKSDEGNLGYFSKDNSVKTPVISRLTTPSTMSPLFPSRESSVYSSQYRGGVNIPKIVVYDSVNNGISVNSVDSVQSVVNTIPRISDIPSYPSNEIYNFDWETRQQCIISEMKNKLHEMDVQYKLQEMEVSSKNKKFFGKVKLGFKYLDTKFSRVESKLDSIYVKYHDISKRKFVWTVWEKGRGNYESYQDFKLSWDPNKKVWSEIKNAVKSDLRSEIENLIHKHDPFKTDKRLDNFLDKRLKSKDKYPFRRT